MDSKKARPRASGSDALGIVVRNGKPAATRTRTVGFMWGPGIYAPPSLPFGRWKVPAGTAA